MTMKTFLRSPLIIAGAFLIVLPFALLAGGLTLTSGIERFE